MDSNEIALLVDQVLDDLERTFGWAADRSLLDRNAGEAVLELWLRRSHVTVHVAALVLRQVHDEIERRAVAAADAARAA